MTIQDDVLKLYKGGAKRIVLKDIAGRQQIGETIGVGSFAGSGNSAASTVSRVEVINVYSKLIITEDGAFERPYGWPANGDYPAGTPVPSPLPNSLIYTGGVLSLDISVLYYEQRRCHIAVFSTTSGLVEDDFLIPLAMPYSGAYYQGLSGYFLGVFSPVFYQVAASASPSDALVAKLAELTGLGVGYE
jgi:hypothetical protein